MSRPLQTNGKKLENINMRLRSSSIDQGGSTMLEVLVTIVILAVGLLGLAGLQSRLQMTEMESYQRAQALILLNDMASRIASNRNFATNYVTATPLGAGMTCPVVGDTQQRRDASEWCQSLQGASETSGGNNVGAMVGGRGCIESLNDEEYMITVAWQGLVPISAPPESVNCGQGEYDTSSENSACKNDLCRRAITTIVRIANLS